MRKRYDAPRALFFRKKLIDPYVAIRDPKGRLRVAIKIMGDMDKAGAQTRCPLSARFILSGVLLMLFFPN
jgi:hypothetical protein